MSDLFYYDIVVLKIIIMRCGQNDVADFDWFGYAADKVMLLQTWKS
jgi:hypothetical protein